MENDSEADRRLARRLKSLRQEHGLTLDALAQESGISRATLSRMETAEVSPTAHVLGKLCTAYGLSMSRLMHMVEQSHAALIKAQDQPIWNDAETGYRRRIISPPSLDLAGEVIAGELKPGTIISYDAPRQTGAEHHVLLQSGKLALTVDGVSHSLSPMDCLRFRLAGPTRFETPPDSGASYLIFLTR